MYLGEYNLGEWVTFNFQALDGYGQAMHATGTPTFEVYGDNVPMTPSVTGELTKIDGQTGFYGGQIAATQANGFAADKAYTIRITAIIDGVETLTTHTFQIAEFQTLSDSTPSFPAVAWQPALNDPFAAGLIAAAVGIINAFGEPVEYHPKVGAARSIVANVQRNGPSDVPGLGVRAEQLRVSVLNTAVHGIASAEVNTGGDRIVVAARLGETPRPRRIGAIASHDVGLMTLEVQ